MPLHLEAIYQSTGPSRAGSEFGLVSASAGGRLMHGMAALQLLTALGASASYEVDVITRSGSTLQLPFRDLSILDILDIGFSSDPLNQCRPLVDAIGRLLTEYARQRGVKTTPVAVSTFSDPDETTTEFVVTQDVELPPDRALAYWDEVAARVEQWIWTLPPDDADRANRYIAVNIQWPHAESTSI